MSQCTQNAQQTTEHVIWTWNLNANTSFKRQTHVSVCLLAVVVIVIVIIVVYIQTGWKRFEMGQRLYGYVLFQWVCTAHTDTLIGRNVCTYGISIDTSLFYCFILCIINWTENPYQIRKYTQTLEPILLQREYLEFVVRFLAHKIIIGVVVVHLAGSHSLHLRFMKATEEKGTLRITSELYTIEVYIFKTNVWSGWLSINTVIVLSRFDAIMLAMNLHGQASTFALAPTHQLDALLTDKFAEPLWAAGPNTNAARSARPDVRHNEDKHWSLQIGDISRASNSHLAAAQMPCVD